ERGDALQRIGSESFAGEIGDDAGKIADLVGFIEQARFFFAGLTVAQQFHFGSEITSGAEAPPSVTTMSELKLRPTKQEPTRAQSKRKRPTASSRHRLRGSRRWCRRIRRRQ